MIKKVTHLELDFGQVGVAGVHEVCVWRVYDGRLAVDRGAVTVALERLLGKLLPALVVLAVRVRQVLLVL